MDRKQSSECAKETIFICKQGRYLNKSGQSVSILDKLNKSVLYSILYKPDELIELMDSIILNKKVENPMKTVIEITGETSLEASRRLVEADEYKVLCLNFASAKNPGGGFLKGSQAQEESIARSSGLYPAISGKKEMYDYNKKHKTGFYSDYMVYSPDVPVFKDDDGCLLDEPYQVSFISSPAVNAGAILKHDPERAHEIRETMLNRIKKIMGVAKVQGKDTLVLGAYGCGVFGNEPRMIAQLFKEALEDERFIDSFKKIVFAIYERGDKKPMLHTFSDVFK